MQETLQVRVWASSETCAQRSDPNATIPERSATISPGCFGDLSDPLHDDILRVRRKESDASGVQAARLIATFVKDPRRRQVSVNVIRIRSDPKFSRAERFFK